MAAATAPSELEARRELPRFDAAERALHWANAVLFGVLLATAAVLYVSPLSAAVGRRDLVRDVHVVAGLLLPLPFVLALAGPWRRGFVDDVRRLNRWTPADRRWFRSFGRQRGLRNGKFNGGQKLNSAFTAGAILVMLATGAVMYWNEPFRVSWRTGATFVHDCLALTLAVVITGHIAYALSDRVALRAMVRGRVPLRWARRHAPEWADELAGPPAPVPSPVLDTDRRS